MIVDELLDDRALVLKAGCGIKLILLIGGLYPSAVGLLQVIHVEV